MSRAIVMVSADRGIAPDGTKGASMHLRSIASALAGRGARVILLSSRRGEVDLPGVELRRFRHVDDVIEAVRGSDADFIYERYSLGANDGLDAARVTGVPFALEVNAPLVDEARRHRPASVLPEHDDAEERLLREADHVFAVSGPLRAWLEARRLRPTHVVWNGCDPTRFVQTGERRENHLVFLGHPKPWHGADSLVTIVRDLHERGRPVTLEIIGGGEAAERIEDAFRSCGLGGYLELTGPVSPNEAALRLGKAAVSLAPYPTQEPFYFCPLKVIESMAAGTPVVTTALGDIPAIVESTGLVVPPDDDAACVDAVLRLLEDPDGRELLGRRARERAHRDLTWDAAAATILEKMARHPRDSEAEG